MDLTDIYRMNIQLESSTGFGTHIFSVVHGNFLHIDYILGHNASFNKYKKRNTFLYFVRS
jgi:hypothetical protein